MELEKKSIKRCQEKGKAFSQITLEDDYIVPDSKPDVLKVIHTQGTILFDEPKISNQALWVNGRMNFSVLYRSDDNGNKLETLTGSIPFQEKLMIDDLEEQDMIRLKGRLEDLTSSVINSRKLAVRAVVEIRAIAEQSKELELTTGIETMDPLETQSFEAELLTLLYCGKDLLRVRREMELPATKPNIVELLYSCVDVSQVETIPSDRGIKVMGDCRICVIYRSEGEEPIQCYESVQSFEGMLDGPQVQAEDIVWIQAEPTLMEIEVREDYDGELRSFGIELNFDISAKVWRENVYPVLADAYALDRSIRLKQEPMEFCRLLLQNQTKVRLADSFHLEKNQERILQICGYCGELQVERTTQQENGILVEGVVKVHLMYLTSDEFLPVAHTQAYLPIEQLVELPEAQGRLRYELSCTMEQLQINLLDASAYEVKAQAALSVMAFEELTLDNVLEIQEEPLDMEGLQRQPGLTGYVVKNGDTLWKIAKAYHTTIDRMMEVNGLAEEVLQPGQKLMIVKEVASC